MDYPALLTDFQRAIDRRRAAEESLLNAGRDADPQEALHRQQLSHVLQSRNSAMQAIEDEFQTVLQAATSEFTEELAREELQYRDTLRRIELESLNAAQEVEKARDDSAWVVSSVLGDRAEDGPLREFERFRTLLHKSREEQITELGALEEFLTAALTERGLEPSLMQEPDQPPQSREDAQSRFSQASTEAREQLKRLNSLLLPKLLSGRGIIGVFLGFLLFLAAITFWFINPSLVGIQGDRMQIPWIGIASGVGVAGSLIITAILYFMSASKQGDLLHRLQELTAEAGWAHRHWLRLAKEQLEKEQRDSERLRRQIAKERNDALRRYESAHASKRLAIENSREQRLQAEQTRHTDANAMLIRTRDEQLMAIHSEHDRQVADATAYWQPLVTQAEEALNAYVQIRQREHRELWSALKGDWDSAWQTLTSASKEAAQLSDNQFPDWGSLAAGHWTPPREIPSAVRLGEIEVDLNAWPQALSDDPRLAPRVTRHHLPLVLTFPHKTSLLLRCPNQAARERAVQVLQSVVLRLLTLVPPGKLRLTILDPIGLGESFSGFMHLADFDELLVTSRIWTEPGQIEARLADLTEHMENVLQKYLRNEFQTIEEYNISAGEVAEPYHILVINDFPSKFSEIAARRLISIVNSGPRCGVYTLMSLDTTKQLPNNFRLEDLEGQMTMLDWRGPQSSTGMINLDDLSADNPEQPIPSSRSPLPVRGGTGGMAFYSREPAVSGWPIEIDRPPKPDQFTRIVRMVGEASKDARRVEVSFERVAPDPKNIWSGDSRQEVHVPLGRAGATKLQQLRLGKGTSQHMLIAGKTGSGKSTFLHILITNLALHYSPDEINFYLIDFKKGVEFKSYASLQLPHARVIAVESDREFGISTLQKLDDVLQERGELFRRQGVQDIAGYRNATGQPLPRILLVVDEFQEFFIEDDRHSQTAALLLDRLVRQGRAFGIHVVLGSQTLGGAYSLARSTLGQVAVRVALQCSEADAHLILSEENTAARLLTRPGEAIYNDANGMAEGNHPFQIAWITDEQRDAYLGQMRDRAQRKGIDVEAPIIFEGNIPSDLTVNRPLSQLADQFSTRDVPLPTPTFWLGDAVEIAPPTELTFQRQSGSHVLLIGQDAEAAQGVMGSALLTLAASQSPRSEPAPIYLFDGSNPGSVEEQNWKNVVGALPFDVAIRRPNQTAADLNILAAELKRREENPEAIAPPLFLFIYNIAKFRELRKAEDDFGMSAFGSQGAEKPVEPGKLLADLILQGPAVGIHLIIWCDSANNLDRWFSRQSMRELEQRIAFQMNASDSSNLIDSPAASRLGTHRALLYREETGTATKFRPYGLPSAEWLSSLRERLRHGPASEFATDLEEFSIL